MEPDEEERYLLAILDSADGIDLAEFAFHDPRNDDGCYRLYDYQWPWFHSSDMYQIDRGARNVGKTERVKLRCAAHPFYHPGKGRLLTAPELNHLRPLTDEVEKLLLNTRIIREMLPTGKGAGIARQPHWQVRFKNGASIMSRLPNKDGKGVKGMHVVELDLDEAQDYPPNGWREVVETLNAGDPDAKWCCHGVSRGVRDAFFDKTAPNSGWTVHRPMAMNRPSWSPEERNAKIVEYGGSRQSVDYKRNIYGEHGDAANSVFVLAKLMNCHPAGTPVWIYGKDGEVHSIPVEDVTVGVRLPTAAGEGVVKSVRSQVRSDLARVVVDGEPIYCTPDHTWLTSRGWVETRHLRDGDVIVTDADLRDLWGTPGLAQAATLLLASLLGCRCPRVVSALPGLWPGDHHPSAEDMLEGLRSDTAAIGESTTGTRLPELRNTDTAWQGHLPVLWDDLCVHLQDSRARDFAMRELRRAVHGQAEPEVLLALLLVELDWEKWRTKGSPHRQVLSGLWRGILPRQQADRVLLEGLRESSPESEGARSQVLPSMREELRSTVKQTNLLQQAMLVRASTGPLVIEAETRSSLDRGAARRSNHGAIGAVDGAGRVGVAVAAGILDLFDGGDPGCRLLANGSCGCASEDRCGARRQEPQPTGTETTRQGTRRLADGARVDSVEILQRGDPDFDRLGGGKDQVNIFFLKVAGHPSYFVGERKLCSHNCVDLDEGSTYNSDVYTCIKIALERFPSGEKTSDDERAALLHGWVDVPGEHFHGYSQRVGNTQVGSPNGYSAYWGGMDVGVTNHPSEILIFGQRVGIDFLELLTRVQMHRINVDDQMLVVQRLFELYGDRLRMGIDKTGVGFGVWDPLTRKSFGDRVHGFGFSEKRVAGFEDRPLEAGETQKDLARMRNVVEASTDWLRNDYVDTKRFRLPYDREIIIEFQGQTYSTIRDNGDPYGVRRQYSGGSFHSLDAAKVAVAAKIIPPLEAMLDAKPTQAPVLDIFMGA